MPPLIHPPYYPIIYVRGYAMTLSEIEDTVATPYMGFNLGSTKIRQRWDRSIERLIFESPLLRLMKEYEYRDAYQDGMELLLDPDPPRSRAKRPRPEEPPCIPPRSVLVYRYYEHDSKDMNPDDAGRRSIEEQAEGLSRMILQLRDQVCLKRERGVWTSDDEARDAFRVYLVAHSMGGLIVRCFLQNEKVGDADAKKMVDKVFTYATPHGGIGVGPLSTVPAFIATNNMNNFSKPRMAEYLALAKTKAEQRRVEDVQTLNGAFDPQRFFCLVGTNSRDYKVAGGMSSLLAGAMSDGLVRIDNATVRDAPRAFVHRSHSGHFGIVNSEEGYQNLVRFLFGDIRVDGELSVSALTLPPRIQARFDKGESVRGSYHFDVITTVRGAEWDLHRRVLDEGSAVFAEYDQLLPRAANVKKREPHLFSLFMSSAVRKRQLDEEPYNASMDEPEDRRSLGFSVMLRVHVPLFEVGGSIFTRERFPNATIYEDTLELRAIPPAGGAELWTLKCRFSSGRQQEITQTAKLADGALRFAIPIEKAEPPGITATLRLTARRWNTNDA